MPKFQDYDEKTTIVSADILLIADSEDAKEWKSKKATIGNVLAAPIAGLTASKPVFTDVSSKLTNTGTQPVDQGGTGVTTLTDHGVLLGSGTAAVSVTAVGANGTVLAGSTGADPAFTATPTGLTSIGVTTVNATTVNATTFDTNVAAAGVTLSGTTLAADGTDAAIDINITPKGTGEVNITKADIDSGTIDGTTIGGTTPAEVNATDINLTGDLTGSGGTASGLDVELDAIDLPENGGVVALIDQSVTAASSDGTEHGWTASVDSSEVLRVSAQSDGAGGVKNKTVAITGGLTSTTTKTAASGTDLSVQIKPTYNQSGTAGGTDLLINRTETAIGSGTQSLIEAQVGGSTRFRVDRVGLVSANSAFVSLSGSLSTTGAFNHSVTVGGSGDQRIISLTPTYNQAGGSTQGNTDIYVDRIETSVGSGTQRLIDLRVGGNDKFYVDNQGKTVTIGDSSISGAIFRGHTDAGAADYNPSALTDDYIITANNSAAARAITISSEDVASGTAALPRIFIIKDEYGSASTYNLTVTLESGGTIDGAASAVLTGDYDSITIYCTGTNAFII